MRNKFLDAGLILLLSALLLTVFYQRKEISKLKVSSDYSEQKVSYISRVLNDNWNFCGLQLKEEFLKAKNNYLGKSSDSIFKNSIIVFRQPVLGCSSCIQEKFEAFKKISDSLKLKTVVVTRESETRNLGLFIRQTQYHDNIFFCNDVLSYLDLMSMTYIFLFENNRITSVHIPDVNFPELTKNYLISIKERFDNNLSH